MPGDRAVDDARQRVQIGPCALRHRGDLAVLLDRRITGLEHHGQRLRHVADDMARRAEVEQQRSVRRQQDVVRRDVAVKTMRFVHRRERIEQRVEPGAQRGFVGRLAAFGQRTFERRPFVVGHHHVGGAVGLPETVNLDERAVVEARQQPRLVDETLQPGLESLEVALRLDRDPETAARARRQRGRHVLFQRDMSLQRRVIREVDDAEAAFADQALDLELGDTGAVGQRVAEERRAADKIATRTHTVRGGGNEGLVVFDGRQPVDGRGARRSSPA